MNIQHELAIVSAKEFMEMHGVYGEIISEKTEYVETFIGFESYGSFWRVEVKLFPPSSSSGRLVQLMISQRDLKVEFMSNLKNL